MQNTFVTVVAYCVENLEKLCRFHFLSRFAKIQPWRRVFMMCDNDDNGDDDARTTVTVKTPTTMTV